MRTIRYLLCLTLLPLLLLAACDNGSIDTVPDIDAGTNQPIFFEIGFAPRTRVSTAADFTSTWEKNDAIGVFAVRHDGSGGTLAASGNYIHNMKLTFDGMDWTPENPIYYPGGGDKLDFYAYYPYNANVADPTAIVFNIVPYQYSLEYFKKSDFMLSEPVTNVESGGAVHLSFVHKLALLQITAINQTGVEITDNFQVFLSDVVPGVTADLRTGSVIPSGTPIQVVPYLFDIANNVFRAIMPAAKRQWTIHLRQGVEFYNLYVDTFDLPAGKVTELEITFKNP